MSSDPYQTQHGQDEAALRAAYGAGASQPPETVPQPAGTPSKWDPAYWSTRAKVISLVSLGAVALAIALAVVLWPSSMTVTGTITSTSINVPLAGGSGICSLPTSGDQLLLKADGVVVATAQLGKSHYKTDTLSGISGCYAWESFTFTGVPGGHTLYEITVSPSSGCQGTLYYTPAKLAKPLGISCS